MWEITQYPISYTENVFCSKLGLCSLSWILRKYNMIIVKTFKNKIMIYHVFFS
jgi:hypothetical protein